SGEALRMTLPRVDRNETHHRIALLTALLLADAPAPPFCADTVPTLELAGLTPERAAALAGEPGRFVFVPRSRPDDLAGSWQVEADGPRLPAHPRLRPCRGCRGPRRGRAPRSSRVCWWSSATRPGARSPRWSSCGWGTRGGWGCREQRSPA